MAEPQNIKGGERTLLDEQGYESPAKLQLRDAEATLDSRFTISGVLDAFVSKLQEEVRDDPSLNQRTVNNRVALSAFRVVHDFLSEFMAEVKPTDIDREVALDIEALHTLAKNTIASYRGASYDPVSQLPADLGTILESATFVPLTGTDLGRILDEVRGGGDAMEVLQAIRDERNEEMESAHEAGEMVGAADATGYKADEKGREGDKNRHGWGTWSDPDVA